MRSIASWFPPPRAIPTTKPRGWQHSVAPLPSPTRRVISAVMAEGLADLESIVHELRRCVLFHGFSDAEVHNILGGNVLNLMERVIGS